MFPEEGRSGALDLEDRAALTAAIDMIATGKADGLVCYSLARLAREITVQEAILAKVWEEAGGRVFTTDQGEVQRDDPDDPMRTAMERYASSPRRHHSSICAVQQVRELPGIGHRLIPVAVVYSRLGAVLTCTFPGRY